MITNFMFKNKCYAIKSLVVNITFNKVQMRFVNGGKGPNVIPKIAPAKPPTNNTVVAILPKNTNSVGNAQTDVNDQPFDIIKITSGAVDENKNPISPMVKDHLIVRDRLNKILLGPLTSSNKYKPQNSLHNLSNVKVNHMYQEVYQKISGKPFPGNYTEIGGYYEKKVVIDNYGKTLPQINATKYKQNIIFFDAPKQYDERAIERADKESEYMKDEIRIATLNQKVKKVEMPKHRI